MAGMTNALANAVLAGYFSNGHWMALHETDPTATGMAGGEVVGGSYGREQVFWTPPSNRTVTNNNTLVYSNLPAAVINFFVFWTAQVGGEADYVLPVPQMTFNNGGTLVVPVQDITITVQ